MIKVQTEVVDILSLKPHKLNARKGNLNAIAESLRVNGQYRPIVVDLNSKEILAGNHTWLAAKSLGWEKIAVTYIDVDSQTAKRIVLADNRTSDLSTYDDSALLDILESLEDLEGTGFAPEDLERLDGLYQEPSESLEVEKVAPPKEEPKDERPINEVRIAHYCLIIKPQYLAQWWKDLIDGAGSKSKLIPYLKNILRIPERVADIELDPKSEVVNIVNTDTVDIDLLQPHPRNARQGDIGAICESLNSFGQYRPIVVNSQDNTILVGNHTYHAAKALGWKQLAVSWVDVDEERALKILLADNRTSDLAAYDDQKLSELLLSISNFEGTGFDGEDIDSIIQGGEGTPLPKKVNFQIGDRSFKVERATFQVWQAALPLDHYEACAKIAARLKLPSTEWSAREIGIE